MLNYIFLHRKFYFNKDLYNKKKNSKQNYRYSKMFCALFHYQNIIILLKNNTIGHFEMTEVCHLSKSIMNTNEHLKIKKNICSFKIINTLKTEKKLIKLQNFYEMLNKKSLRNISSWK